MQPHAQSKQVVQMSKISKSEKRQQKSNDNQADVQPVSKEQAQMEQETPQIITKSNPESKSEQKPNQKPKKPTDPTFGPHSGDRMVELLQKHENIAFTITQLAKSLGISRVSARKHAKRLSKLTSQNPESDTQSSQVRMSRGPGKFTGTGAIVWLGKSKYESIFKDGEPQI
jgi:hypothetical protein